MDETEIYPVDVTKLNRGDVVSQGECERILGVTVDHARYRLKLEWLRDWIFRETEKNGDPLSVATYKNGLRVNTDEEASRYHAHIADQCESRIFLNQHRLIVTVRRDQLTQREQAAHDRRLALMAQRVFRLRREGVTGVTARQIERKDGR